VADETASTIVVGGAYVKHRFYHTDSVASDDSHEFADFRSLREGERAGVIAVLQRWESRVQLLGRHAA
jgi:hypothetical protein